MRRERGQAGVETLVALPLLVLIVLAAVQASAWVATSVLAGLAADAAVRAQSRGEPALPAARAELPGPARRLLRLTSDAGTVHVVLRVPVLLPGLPGLHVSAQAAP
jgi:hypothetical protein